jgi:DNA-binding transcriptional LysR family regulator
MASSIDLVTLRAIVAVADCGSISAGSDQVRLALAAVSARIATLEADLGFQIFNRTSRGVLITPGGHMLVRRARELLADADRLQSDLHDYRLGVQGHVRLVANASSMLQVLPQRLEVFRLAHPFVKVEVEEKISSEIPGAVLDGRADIGILDLVHPLQGLRVHDMFVNHLGLIVSSRHALAARSQVSLAEAIRENFIGLIDGNAIAIRLNAAAMQCGEKINVRMQMRSFDAVCRMVAEGQGIGVLPVEAIAPQLAYLPIVAISLADPWATRTHRLAMREGATPSMAAESLAKILYAAAE